MTFNMPFSEYTFSISPITPVHIGSGEPIEPFRYKLFKDEDGVPSLAVLDLDKLFDSLSDRDRRALNTKLDSCNYVALRKFIHDIADESEHSICTLEVTEDAWNTLLKSVDKVDREGGVHLHIRNPISGEPYIPGSSLKGSIRTALINYWANKAPGNKVKVDDRFDRRSSANFEARVMGNQKQDMLKDPLICLNVPDIPMDEYATYISGVEIVRPKLARSRDREESNAKILIFREVTWTNSDDENQVFSTKIRLADQNFASKRALPKSITPEEICTACNSFYIPNLESEVKRFEVSADCLDALQDAKQIVCENPKQKAIIRVGRHSHFENVTIKGQSTTPKKGAGKSRTYVDGFFPLGWALIEFAEA